MLTLRSLRLAVAHALAGGSSPRRVSASPNAATRPVTPQQNAANLDPLLADDPSAASCEACSPDASVEATAQQRPDTQSRRAGHARRRSRPVNPRAASLGPSHKLDGHADRAVGLLEGQERAAL